MTDMSLDPVTLAILKGRLEQIADEMDATLFRSAFNPIIAEAHDASHGIYDAITGETLVQGKSGLPIFVGVMAFAVKAVIEKVARDGNLSDGDVFIFNDPMRGGRICLIFDWSSRSIEMEPSFVIWLRLGIGMMWAAMFLEITIQKPRNLFKKAC